MKPANSKLPNNSNLLLGLTFLVVFVAFLAVSVNSQQQTSTATPPADEYNCSLHSDSCDDCVKSSVHCYYCYKTKLCGVYPWSSLQPPADCGDSLSDFSWKTCAVNANVLVIVLGSLGGLLGLIILIFICYCCFIKPCLAKCRERQEAKWERNRVRLSEMQSQRRKERQQQRDAIRAKYGLNGPQYDKF